AEQQGAVAVGHASTTAVQVQKAAALSLQLQAPTLVEGFGATFTATISNTGGAQVDSLGIEALDVTDAGGASVLAATSGLPSGPLPGGGHVSFDFSVVPPTGAGTLTVVLRVAGLETNTAERRAAQTSSGPLPVLSPGGLVAGPATLPAAVTVGQVLPLVVKLTNTGQTSVTAAVASLSQRGATGDGAASICRPALRPTSRSRSPRRPRGRWS